MKSLGLNEHLQPLDSPVTQVRPFVKGYDFDISHEIPIGKINYSNLDINTKPYQAVVSLARTKGAFQDIQEAINYVNSLGGGRIFLRTGTYTMDKNITLYSNISLIGEDNDTTIIDFNDLVKGMIINGTSGEHLRNIHLENFQVTNSHNTSLGAVDILYTDDIYIDAVYFNDNYDVVNVPAADILILQSRGVYISSCRFTLSKNSIQMATTSLCSIVDSYFTPTSNNNENIAINSGCYRINIQNNYFDSIDNPAIISHGTSLGGSTILGNTIIKPGAQSSGSGMEFNDSTEGLIIANNYINHPGTLMTNGMRLTGCSKVQILGNYIKGASGDGILIRDNSDDNIVNGNIIDTCTDWGINISTADCNKNIVTSNRLISTDGFNDAGTDTSSNNNVT